VKNQSRFQYGQLNDNSRTIQRQGINRISPITNPVKTLSKELISTPEISKGIFVIVVISFIYLVQQIFSKVTETFKFRQEGTHKLQDVVTSKEFQLKFLEQQIKEQIETTAKQSASYSIINHQVKKLTSEIEKLSIEIPGNIRTSYDELSRTANYCKL
jgi:superfamily II helicase